MKKTALLIGLASLMFVAGCGYQTTPTITTTPTTTTTPTEKILPKDITITNYQFSPTITEISPEGTIRRTNNDNAPHDVVADDGSFKSVLLQQGESFSFKFSQAGTYTYYCGVHPSMKGTVIVK